MITTRGHRWASGLLVVTLVLIGAGCSDDGEDVSTGEGDGGGEEVASTTEAPDEPTTSAPGLGGSATPAPGATAVDIADYAFEPTPLTVSVGDTVTWSNQDDFAHTSTGDEDEWMSGDLEPGASFEHTFETPGTFAYHCSIHNFMQGEIVVEG